MGRPRLALIAGVLVLAACSGRSAQPALEAATLLVQTDTGPVRIRVEVADSPEETSRGLMFREELAADAGMVFLADDPTMGGFWMKNTLIPLSVAFWGEDGEIGAILDMEPCKEDPCPVYYPEIAWIGAVEVNQGFFDRTGVEIGDPVHLEA